MAREPDQVSNPEREGSTLPRWARRVAQASWAFVGVALATTIVIVGIATLSELVVPLVVAVVAAVVFAPGVDWLQARRIPRSAGAAAITLLIVMAAVAMVVLVVVGVVDRADELADELDQALAQVSDSIENPAISGFFADLDIDLDATGATIARGAGTRVTSLIGSAIGLISGLILALVLLYYLLKDGSAIVERTVDRRAPDTREQSQRILHQAAETLRANSKGRTILAVTQGVFVFVVMALLDVPLPATIGIVNFVGAFIPFLGAFVGGAFAVVMAISEGGMALATWALIAIVFMNLVLENLLEPRLIGNTMRMHPITVLIATVAGGVIAGLLGLILAAPAVAIGSNLVSELRATGFFRSNET